MTTPVAHQLLPTAVILRHMFRANAEHGFIYLNNPKVGCSTIKAALWSGVTGSLPPPGGKGAHELEGAPFRDWVDDPDMAERAFIFTAVRNPFQRIVSAFLDKIEPAEGEIWETFVKQSGLNGKALSFDEFIEVLSGQVPEKFDPHWRPQSLNILYPFVRPNLLTDLETLDQVLPGVIARLFPGREVTMPGQRQRSHGTSARKTWRAHLADAATLKRVIELFAGDFDAFGYKPDLAVEPGLAVPVQTSEHRHEGLGALLRFWNSRGTERPKQLWALDRLDKAGQLRAWSLSHKLGYNAKNPGRVEELLARNSDLLANPPGLLRRAMEQVRQGRSPEGQSEG